MRRGIGRGKRKSERARARERESFKLVSENKRIYTLGDDERKRFGVAKLIIYLVFA
jgi:hypothetical protein